MRTLDRPPDRRRCKPVRVSTVPEPERLRAARVAIRHEPDPDERIRILLLAYEPGDLVAWVAP